MDVTRTTAPTNLVPQCSVCQKPKWYRGAWGGSAKIEDVLCSCNPWNLYNESQAEVETLKARVAELQDQGSIDKYRIAADHGTIERLEARGIELESAFTYIEGGPDVAHGAAEGVAFICARCFIKVYGHLDKNISRHGGVCEKCYKTLREAGVL